jgi:hypothetical protein
MRLVDLLAETSVEELERLAHEHARADEQLSRPQLLGTIEGVRSSGTEGACRCLARSGAFHGVSSWGGDRVLWLAFKLYGPYTL